MIGAIAIALQRRDIDGIDAIRRDDLGVIAPGKLADVIVLDRDPSTDIHAIRSVSRVMVDGRWADRPRYLRW